MSKDKPETTFDLTQASIEESKADISKEIRDNLAYIAHTLDLILIELRQN